MEYKTKYAQDYIKKVEDKVKNQQPLSGLELHYLIEAHDGVADKTVQKAIKLSDDFVNKEEFFKVVKKDKKVKVI